MKPRFFLIITLFSIFCPFEILARDDDLDDRRRVVNKRNERFYKNDFIRNYVELNGKYHSDQVQKDYTLKFSHFYKSKKWISDVDLQMETQREEQKNCDLCKDSDLYRAIISEKFTLFDTQNYFVFFNESRYDDEAQYAYYDIITAAGFGRMFFDDRLEIDFAFGKAKAKDISSVDYFTRVDYNRDVFIPAFRTEFDIFNGVRYVQRGFLYYSDNIDSYYLNTRLQYPLSRRVYLQLSHIIEARSYHLIDQVGSGKNKRIVERNVNETDRQILLGFRYDFGVGGY